MSATAYTLADDGIDVTEETEDRLLAWFDNMDREVKACHARVADELRDAENLTNSMKEIINELERRKAGGN